jgi:hypothetical protein
MYRTYINMSDEAVIDTNAGDAAKSNIPEILIDGQPYKVEFSWPTFAEARTKHGEDPDLMNPAVLSEFVALALKRHHPMVTADQIMTASPPMVPVAKAVRAAITRLFWGDTPPSA